MKKSIISLGIIVVFLPFGSLALFSMDVESDAKIIRSNSNIQTEKNTVKTRNVQGAVGSPEIIERDYDRSMVEFYTGKPIKSETFSNEDIEPNVYVQGVNAHSGNAITVYSKVKQGASQTVSLKLDGQILKVFVDESQESNAKQNVVLQTLLTEEPTHFEIYRNGICELRKEISYSIE